MFLSVATAAISSERWLVSQCEQYARDTVGFTLITTHFQMPFVSRASGQPKSSLQTFFAHAICHTTVNPDYGRVNFWLHCQLDYHSSEVILGFQFSNLSNTALTWNAIPYFEKIRFQQLCGPDKLFKMHVPHRLRYILYTKERTSDSYHIRHKSELSQEPNQNKITI